MDRHRIRVPVVSARAHPLRLSALVVCGGLAGGTITPSRADPQRPALLTFGWDVAPLVFAKCGPCHHPGGAGPFSLLGYDDVVDHGPEILKLTQSRFMPPWRPFPGYAEYANDRSLSDAQIDLLRRWFDQGAKLGDPREVPPAPTWRKGWQLGEPDLVVELAEPFSLAASGRDVYRNFVIPAPVREAKYVIAWEFRPETRTIHHGILNVDRLGIARRRDALDPGPGFGGMDVGEVQSADGFYLVWVPGKEPTLPDPTMSWRIDEHTDLVLQLHMQPTGKPETVRPKIGLYLSDRPPQKQRFTLRIGDPPIDIAPGDADYRIHSEQVLAADADVLSVFPHAHYVAKRMRSWATLPDGSERALLRIDEWDFNWQDEYAFARPVFLPRGTRIEMEFVYDNSEGNVRNPSHPPRRVRTGERSTDEMGNVTFQVMPREPNGMNLLREAKYRSLVASVDIPRNHYNLANALADLGRPDEAIEQYRRAIDEDPSFAPARVNLGNLLLSRGDVDGAILQYREAVRIKADFVSALVQLGNALKRRGQLREATSHYRDAVAADPRSAVAHNSLALALAEANDLDGAIGEFRAALTLEPDNWLSHYHFANALRAHGDEAEALAHFQRASELRPYGNEIRR